MTLKKYIFTGLSVSALFLVACEQDSIEDVELSADELENLHGEIVDQLNGLYEDENQLQDDFSQTLEEDEDLSSLADGSSPVFDNLESRESRLNALEEFEGQLSEHADTLNGYEGERLPTEDLSAIADEVNMFSEELAGYREEYVTTIESQTNYFNEIASEDATYEIFSDGIQTINDQRSELQSSIIELDESLIQYDEAVAQLQSLLDEATTEEE